MEGQAEGKILGWLFLLSIISMVVSFFIAMLPVIIYLLLVFIALVSIYSLLPKGLQIKSFETWIYSKQSMNNQSNSSVPNHTYQTQIRVPNVVNTQPELDFTKIASQPAQVVPSKEQLESALKAKVIGQDTAITSLARMVRGKLASQNNPKPLVILLPGQTGTGKTEMSKALAEALQSPLNRFDMGEFGEEHKVSNLFGSAAGYVGSESGGKLPNILRQHSQCCVILFDEVEKAHQSLWRRMLGFFDEGRVSDTLGQVTAPKNTICILTSNIEADKVGDAPDRAKEIIKNSGYFPPEFIARIDKVIPMVRLSQEDLAKLTVILAQRLGQRFGIELIIDQVFLKVIVAKTLLEAKAYGGRGITEKLSDLFMDDLIDLQGERVTHAKLAFHENGLKVVKL